MFLSPAAQKLLDEDKIDELQKLPLKDLIGGNQFEPKQLDSQGFHLSHIVRSDASNITHASASPFEEMCDLDFLENPVALSSGHIISRRNAERILAGLNPRCPQTCKPITAFVELPLLDEAVKKWKAEANEKKKLKDAQNQPNDQKDEKEGKEEKISADNKNVLMTIMISGGLLLIKIKNSDDKYMNKYFCQAFTNANMNRVTSHQYSCHRWGRVWQANENRSMVEWWFRPDTLTEKNINEAIEAILAPLALPAAEQDDALKTYSLNSLTFHRYVSVVENLQVTQGQAIQCFGALINYSELQLDKLCIRKEDVDIVKAAHGIVPRSTYVGLGVFGASVPSQQPAASAARQQQPAASSSSSSLLYNANSSSMSLSSSVAPSQSRRH